MTICLWNQSDSFIHDVALGTGGAEASKSSVSMAESLIRDVRR